MRVEVDGRPAVPAELVSTHGHFTAMQVRGGRVQGLAYHLDRLDAAHRELFGRPLAGDRVRDLVRHALDGVADASVRVAARDATHVMVSVDEPQSPPTTPQRLCPVPYVRPFAHLKHLGGFAQVEWARRVRLDGYDDALLTAPADEVAEASIANLVLFDADGTAVVPAAPHLHGTGLRLVEATTPTVTRRVRLRDLGSYVGAFVVNSIGIAPVASVGDTVLPDAADLVARVVERVAAVGWDPL